MADTEQEDGLEKDYFELGTDEEYFEHRYHFMTENNDWGDLIYYVNGEETNPWEWERNPAGGLHHVRSVGRVFSGRCSRGGCLVTGQ